MKTGFVAVPGGEIYFECAGGASDRVILLHNALVDRRMWDQQFEMLAESFSVLRYDVRQHGRSGNDGREYLFADDLEILLDELDFVPAHFVGAGGGGAIAIDYALKRPESVLSLTLAPPRATGNQWSAELLAAHDKYNAALAADDYAGAVEERLRLWIDGPRRSPSDVDPAVRDGVRDLMLDNYVQVVADMRAQARTGTRIARQPGLDRLEEVGAPALLVVGDQDQSEALELARTMNDRLPNAELRMVSGSSSTIVTLEKPAEFNEMLLRFIESVRTGRR